MKKKWKISILTAILALTMSVLAACGGNDKPADQGKEGESQKPKTIRIGSASQGGTYYIYAGGVATLIQDKLGVTTNVEVTGGPVHNMQLLAAGDIDLGFVTLGPAYEGFTGTGDWTGGNKLDNVRVVFPMYTTPFKWWALEKTGIKSLADIKGKSVGVGPAGGTSGTYNPLIHKELGLNTKDVQIGASDMASQMLDGQLDVIGFAAGTPISIVSEIEAQRKINMFGIDGADRDAIIKKFPFFYKYTLPAGSYNAVTADMETIAMYNFGVVRADMDADFVYEMVKAYHENNADLVLAHSSAEEATIEAILNNTSVPLHPGAIRFYEEKGIQLPDSVK